MYYLYVRGKAHRHPGSDHWTLLGIFPPSYYWSDAWHVANENYGRGNVIYRWHA